MLIASRYVVFQAGEPPSPSIGATEGTNTDLRSLSQSTVLSHSGTGLLKIDYDLPTKHGPYFFIRKIFFFNEL